MASADATVHAANDQLINHVDGTVVRSVGAVADDLPTVDCGLAAALGAGLSAVALA
jgi:hypothetical protein